MSRNGFPISALLLLLAGCAEREPEPTVPSGPLIEIVGLRFEPAELSILPGTVVTFRNLDQIPHSVVVEDGFSFDTGIFYGDAFVSVPEAVATGTRIPFVCGLHREAGESGTLIVVQ